MLCKGVQGSVAARRNPPSDCFPLLVACCDPKCDLDKALMRVHLFPEAAAPVSQQTEAHCPPDEWCWHAPGCPLRVGRPVERQLQQSPLYEIIVPVITSAPTYPSVPDDTII
jgi:hypothetical protein